MIQDIYTIINSREIPDILLFKIVKYLSQEFIDKKLLENIIIERLRRRKLFLEELDQSYLKDVTHNSNYKQKYFIQAIDDINKLAYDILKPEYNPAHITQYAGQNNTVCTKYYIYYTHKENKIIYNGLVSDIYSLLYILDLHMRDYRGSRYNHYYDSDDDWYEEDWDW